MTYMFSSILYETHLSLIWNLIQMRLFFYPAEKHLSLDKSQRDDLN